MANEPIDLRKGTVPWALSANGTFDPAANDVGFQSLSTVVQALSASYGSAAQNSSQGAKYGFLALNMLGSLGYGASFLEPVRKFLIGPERFEKRKAEDALLEKKAKGRGAKIGTLGGLLPRSAAQMMWIAMCNAAGPLIAVVGTTYRGPGHEWVGPVSIVCSLGAMLGYAYCQTKAFGDSVTGRTE